MAVTKINSKQIAAVPTDQLLSQRDEAQRIIASAPKNSADYKAATANLNTLNKEIGKDLGIGGNAKSLTATQLLDVNKARSNLDTTVNIGTVPASVQKSINSALEKNVKTEEKKIISSLANSQQSEIRALKDAEVDKATLNAAIADNKKEISGIKTTLAPTGFQGKDAAVTALLYTNKNPDGTDGQKFIRSGNAAYANTTAGQEATRILDAGYGLLDEFNLPPAYKTGKTTIGFSAYNAGLAALDRNTETGEFQRGQYLNTAVDTSGRSISHALSTFNKINEDLVNPAAVSSKAKVVGAAYDSNGNLTGNIVQDVLQEYKKGNTVGFYLQKPDGSYQYLSGNKEFTPTGGGGFLRSTLGKIVLGVAGSLLVPGLGSVLAGGSFLPAAGAAYGAGSTIGSLAAAGGLVGAGTAAITGDDILTGGLLGAAGGAAGGYIGKNGGLGNVLAKNGITMSQSTIDTLNGLVSGIGQPTLSQANAAATVMTNSGIATTVDDIAAATGGVVDDVTGATFRPGQTITGLLDDTGAGLRLTPNVQEGFIPTPSGGGTLQSIPTPVPGSLGRVGFNPNAGGIGFQVNPQNYVPTPVGGGTVPDVSGVNTNLDRYISPPIGGNTVTTGSGEYPSAVNNGGGLLDSAKKIIDDAVTAAIDNPLTTLGIVSTIPGIVNPPTVPSVKPPVLSPDINFNPAMFGTAGPGFDFDAFMNLYRRGGLGAGQYLGYDLMNRLGDIPLQTLLGTPIMGGQVGQTNASTASLV